MVRGSSPWLLLVVAFEQISTMQLFVWEAVVWLTSQYAIPINEPKIVSELHDPHVL